MKKRVLPPAKIQYVLQGGGIVWGNNLERITHPSWILCFTRSRQWSHTDHLNGWHQLTESAERDRPHGACSAAPNHHIRIHHTSVMQSVLCHLELVWKTGGRYYNPVINELRENKHEVSYEVKNCRSAAVDVRWEIVRVKDREESNPPGRGGAGQGSTQYMWVRGLFWLGLLFFTPTVAHHPPSLPLHSQHRSAFCLWVHPRVWTGRCMQSDTWWSPLNKPQAKW